MSAKRYNLEWRLKPQYAGSHTLDADKNWSVIVSPRKKRKTNSDRKIRLSKPTVNLTPLQADTLLAHWLAEPDSYLFEYRMVAL